MGAQRVLQVALLVVSGIAYADKPRHEKVALTDLGQPDATVHRSIEQAIANAGLEPLAFDTEDRDTVQLAAAIDEAQRAFGALDCAKTKSAADRAILIGAGRQAAGLAVPELARAWSLELLCADRTNDTDVAMLAATRLRALGGSTDVPADLMAKYPEVDAIGGADRIPVEISGGASVWIDHRVASAKWVLSPGSHLIAVADGTKRGAIVVMVARGTNAIAVPTTDVKAELSDLGARIAAWKGKVPSTAELAWVLDRVKARVAIIRYGDTLEAWGRIGASESPHRLGAEDGVGPVGDAARIMALVVDRVQAWTDRSPDPDQPLLLETRKTLEERKREPTQWWVYATIAGAIAGAALVVYLHDSADDVQHVELHYP